MNIEGTAKRAARLILSVVALLVSGVEQAPAHTGDARVAAALFLKILSFDRALKDHEGVQLAIGVVYAASSAEGHASAVSMREALDYLGHSRNVTVHGRAFSTFLVPIDEDDVIRDRLVALDAIYIAGHSEEVVAPVTQAGGLGNVCGERSYLDQGGAVAIVGEEGKPHIYVNLSASRAAGMLLDPQLLRLAELVGAP